MAIEFTSSNWNQEVLQSDKPVLVDFWAEWCGPCKMMNPIIEEIYKEYEGKAIVGKLNVSENSDISAKYAVRSIPAILIFKNGELIDKTIGVTNKNILALKIEQQLQRK